MVLPSGLYAADVDSVGVAGELAQLLAGGGIPDAGGLVVTGGDDGLAVRAVRRRRDRVGVAGELAQLLAGGRIPDAGGLVVSWR